MSQSFWDFSLAVYGGAGVQDECLRLQDEYGLDVNLILLCAFLGARRGVALTVHDIAAACLAVRQWQEEIVCPLRTARRSLKTSALADDQAALAAQLRTQVKRAELEAERIEQAMLETWVEARLAGWRRADPGVAVVANLQALLAEYGVDPDRLAATDAMRHLIAAAR